VTEQRLAEIEARAEKAIAAYAKVPLQDTLISDTFDDLLSALRAAEAREARLREALTERIDYHDHYGSMAEGADMPESAAHHDAIRKELETIRTALEQKP
jgi:hypothetical protein